MVSLQQGALQIFCGALGTLGFALFFFVRPKHLLLATLGGALSWLIYLLVLHGGGVCFWLPSFLRWPSAFGQRPWPACERLRPSSSCFPASCPSSPAGRCIIR